MFLDYCSPLQLDVEGVEPSYLGRRKIVSKCQHRTRYFMDLMMPHGSSAQEPVKQVSE